MVPLGQQTGPVRVRPVHFGEEEVEMQPDEELLEDELDEELEPPEDELMIIVEQ